MRDTIIKYSSVCLVLLSIRNALSSFVGFDNKLFFLISFALVAVCTTAYYKNKKQQLGFVSIILTSLLIWVYLTVLRSIPDLKDKYYLLTFTAMAPSFLCLISIFYLSSAPILKQIITFFFKIVIPFSILFIPVFLHNLEVVGFYFVLLVVPLLFLDEIRAKRKILVLFLVLVVGWISYISGARSTVVKFFMGFLIWFGCSKFPILTRKIAKPLAIILIILPIFLFVRSIQIQKSPFTELEELMSSNSSNSEEEIDTRTFVMYEGIISAVDNNYILWGRNFAHGYESMNRFNINNTTSLSNNERISEVGMLNIFTNQGLIGVVLFYLLISISALKAVYLSKSIVMLKIGLYLSFTAFYTWIENALYLDYTTLSIFIFISIASNNELLKLDSSQVKKYVSYILN